MSSSGGDVEEIARSIAGARTHPLSNPVRLAVMLLLAARGSMEFAELQRALGVSSGSLWKHVERLSAEGYVETKYRVTALGPRLVVSATEKGIRETVAYLERHARALETVGG